MINTFIIKVKLTLLVSIFLTAASAQELTIGAYPTINFPLFIKNSVTNGKPSPGFGFNVGLTPQKDNIGIQALAYYEQYLKVEESIKIEVEDPNNYSQGLMDVCSVTTSHFKVGVNIGFAFPTKKENRSVAPTFGFYIYNYSFSYIYDGTYEIDNIYLTKLNDTNYKFKTGTIGLAFDFNKYYHLEKFSLFWTASIMTQKFDFDERTYGFYHLKTLPFTAISAKFGIVIPIKPLIEKLSLY
jgi:hypothetical protein